MAPETSSFWELWSAALTLFLVALMMRACARSWFSAGPFYALAWSGYLSLPLVLAPDYPVSPMSLWWIVLCVLAVCAGDVWASCMTHSGARPENSRDDPDRLPLPGLRTMLTVAIVCGLLSSVVAIVESGRSFSLFLSGEAYVQTAHELSVGRYSQEYVPSTLGQILLTGAYLSPMLGGILFCVKRSRQDGALGVTSLLPVFAITLLHTTRATFFFGGVLWLSSYWGMQVWRNRETTPFFTSKGLAVSAGIGGLVVMLFCFGQVVRVGDAPTLDALLDAFASPHLRAWFFGYLSAFSGWFGQSWDTREMAWGGYSLAGVFDQLGFLSRAQGLYTDVSDLASGARSNIYTVFRGLIQDFTLPGTLLFLWMVGGIAAHAHRRTAHGHLAWMPILIAFYAFTGDFLSSIFNYNSILLAWILLGLYIWGICLRPRLGWNVTKG